MKNKNGISLIVLIITIIVLAILTSVIILSISDVNLNDSLDEMSFKNDLAVYAEEVKSAAMNMYSEDKEVFEKTYSTKEEIEKFSSKLVKSDFIDLVVVKNGELVLKKSKITDEQKNWASQIRLEVDESL